MSEKEIPGITRPLTDEEVRDEEQVKLLRPAPNPYDDGSVLNVLEHELAMFKEKNDLQAVVILGLRKEGGPTLSFSTSTGMEKSYMIAFLNAWFDKWMFNEA